MYKRIKKSLSQVKSQLLSLSCGRREEGRRGRLLPDWTCFSLAFLLGVT